MRRVAAVASTIALLALALPSGAPAFRLSAGHAPRVAVDGSGTGYFTWTNPGASSSDTFHYCRLSSGGSLCDATFAYNDGKEDVNGGYTLFPGDGRVLLLDARCCTPYALKEVWTSSDGGKTFGSPVSPGSMDGAGDNISGNAVYAPPGAVGRAAESLLTVSDIETEGIAFQATDTGAGTTTARATLGGSGGSYQGSLALQGTSTLVAIYGTLGPANLYWRMWNGSGDVNDAANWTAPALLGPTNVFSTAKLVSGPSGLFVAYSTGPDGKHRYVLRRFTGSGWGAPLTLSEIGSPSNADLYEDSAGVLHFAWQDSSDALRYRYARSATNGAFTRPQKVVASGNFPELKIAVDAAGHGWATWSNNGVQVHPLAPGEPTVPYKGPTKTSQTGAGSDRLVLTSPAACLKPATTFTAKLGAKPKKKHHKASIKIKKVVFLVDGKQVAVDKKKPFTYTAVSTRFGKGKHKLVVKVTGTVKKQGKNKKVKKTLQSSFSLC